MYVMQKIHQKDQKGLGMKSSRHKRNRFSLTGFGQESVQSVIEISHHRSSAQNPFGASTWRTMKILRIYNGIHARYFLTICGQSVHVAKTMLFEFLNPDPECMVSSLSYTAIGLRGKYTLDVSQNISFPSIKSSPLEIWSSEPPSSLYCSVGQGKNSSKKIFPKKWWQFISFLMNPHGFRIRQKNTQVNKCKIPSKIEWDRIPTDPEN